MNLGIGLKRLMASVLVAGGLVAPAMGQDCDGNGVRDRLECGPVGWTPGMNNTDGIMNFTYSGAALWGGVSSQLQSILNPARFTIDFWMNHSQAASGRGVFFIGDQASGRGLFFRVDSGSTSVTTGDYRPFAFGASTAPDGQWHHWALTYDLPNGVRKLYRDGELVGTSSLAGPLSIGINTPVRIGGDLTTVFDGGIDEFRIWDRPLTQAEIAGLQDVYMDQDFGAYPGLRVYHAFSPATGPLDDPFNVLPLSGNTNLLLIQSPPDSNGNGVPDGCETDADGDGIDDSMQLSPLPGTERFRFFDRPQAMTRLTQAGGIVYGSGLVPVYSSFTLEMWVYRSTKTGDQEFLIDHGDHALMNRNLHIGFRAGDEFVMGFWGDDLETTQAYPPDGQWHHWACTYDSDTQQRKIYRDGELVAQDVSSSIYYPSSYESVIGSLRDPRFPFHGAMDELRVWNRVLTQNEIQAGMHQALNLQSWPNNLYSYISFNEADPYADVVGRYPTNNTRSWTPTSLDGILVPQVVGAGNDCNGNGVADSFDISSGASGDCNGNGVPDECDIDLGISEDCNGNGIPDECESDCNGNGVPDECDLLDGTAFDCNGNGVIDSCDIASGTSVDCNGNGIPDECDLLDGTAFDCNGNGVIDSCDIASGTSVDCNEDGIPDECQSDLDADGNGIIDACQGILNVTTGTYYPSLSQAVAEAQNGSVIEIAPGEYDISSGLDVVWKSLTIRGQDPDDESLVRSTRIVGGSIYFDPGFTASRLELVGINFGTLYQDLPYMYFDSPPKGCEVLIDRCWIEYGAPSSNSAIYHHQGALTVRESTISNVGVAIASNGPIGGGSGPIISRTVSIVQSRIVNCTNAVIFTSDSQYPVPGAVVIDQSLIEVAHPFSGVHGDAVFYSGSVGAVSESLRITNSIIRGGGVNVGGLNTDFAPSLYCRSSNIQGGLGLGAQLIDEDPMYVDADGPDDDPFTVYDNDYRLLPGSPCLDAGADVLIPSDVFDADQDGNRTEYLPFAIDGQARIQGQQVDMGPYEGAGPPVCGADLNNDGEVNFFDVSVFLSLYNAGCP